jgi:hypothetical protein
MFINAHIYFIERDFNTKMHKNNKYTWKLSWMIFLYRARAVRITTGYGLNGQGNGVQNPVVSRILNFPSLPG